MARRNHDDDDDAEKSRFRWLDAARYALAAVVTVLIVAVIANAIKVVLRPDTLLVSVVGGSVTVKPSPPTSLVLFIDLLRQNPSGRAVMYYTNVTGYLFDNSTSPATLNPADQCFTLFFPKDVAVLQDREVDSIVKVTVDRGVAITNASFDLLSGSGSGGGGGILRGVTLRLDGNLTTQTASGGKNTTIPTTYYCPQLVVGGDPDDPAYKGNQNVLCTSDVVHQGGSRHRRFCFSMLAAAMVALIQTSLL